MISLSLPNFTKITVDLNMLAPCNSSTKLMAEMKQKIFSNLLTTSALTNKSLKITDFFIINNECE